jgi:hypothetical protein
MSSRSHEASGPGGFVGSEAPEDLVADPAAESSDGFGSGVALSDPVIEIGPTWSSQADRGRNVRSPSGWCATSSET